MIMSLQWGPLAALPSLCHPRQRECLFRVFLLHTPWGFTFGYVTRFNLTVPRPSQCDVIDFTTHVTAPRHFHRQIYPIPEPPHFALHARHETRGSHCTTLPLGTRIIENFLSYV